MVTYQEQKLAHQEHICKMNMLSHNPFRTGKILLVLQACYSSCLALCMYVILVIITCICQVLFIIQRQETDFIVLWSLLLCMFVLHKAQMYFANQNLVSEILLWADPDWTPCAQQRPSITSILKYTGNRKYHEQLLGQDKDRERSFTNYHHRQKRFDLGK